MTIWFCPTFKRRKCNSGKIVISSASLNESKGSLLCYIKIRNDKKKNIIPWLVPLCKWNFFFPLSTSSLICRYFSPCSLFNSFTFHPDQDRFLRIYLTRRLYYFFLFFVREKKTMKFCNIWFIFFFCSKVRRIKIGLQSNKKTKERAYSFIHTQSILAK